MIAMTHYHYYVTAGDQVDATSCIYLVAVGHGRQADRDYLFLMANSVNCGHYFAIRSSESSDFIVRLQESTLPDILPVIKIKARDLVRNIKASLREPLSAASLHNAHHMRNYLSTQYLLSSRTAARPSSHA